jgi:small conductance mechanosensitive channel
VVAALSFIAAELAARLARMAFASILRRDPQRSFTVPLVHRPIRIVRLAVFLAVGGALILPALDMAGVRMSSGRQSAALSTWLFDSGLRIVLIGTIAYVLVRFIAAAARRLEDEIGDEPSPDAIERIKRAKTIGRLVQHALTTSVVSIAGLMMLRELRVDILPVLTGAGIVGLAVGFGAQTLVKDLIAGFFLTFENQVRVGDVADINGVGGLVESINLRTIVLRDAEGVVHVFPNGSIERLANRSKDFAYAVIDLGVRYSEDTDRVFELLKVVGAALAADPGYRHSVLAPFEVLGIDAFKDTHLVIKSRIKTLPLKQWDVGRELRRRIKAAFDERGIPLLVAQLPVAPAPVGEPSLTAADRSRHSAG